MEDGAPYCVDMSRMEENSSSSSVDSSSVDSSGASAHGARVGGKGGRREKTAFRKVSDMTSVRYGVVGVDDQTEIVVAGGSDDGEGGWK